MALTLRMGLAIVPEIKKVIPAPPRIHRAAMMILSWVIVVTWANTVSMGTLITRVSGLTALPT
ncbi:hypothetical protein Holit_03397 [Hollandina sp. SP2]